MSLADAPTRTTEGHPICPECSDPIVPGDPHTTCNLTVVTSPRSPSQGAPDA